MAKGTCPVCGGRHFGLCHKCPHGGEEMEKVWKRRKWEHTPCATCALSAEGRAAGHGRGLSLEHVPARELLRHGEPEGRGEAFEWFTAEDPREVVARLLAFFRAWIEASEDEARWMRDYVAHGLTNEQVAKRDGIAPKTASARRARVMGLMGWKWDPDAEEWRWAGGAA